MLCFRMNPKVMVIPKVLPFFVLMHFHLTLLAQGTIEQPQDYIEDLTSAADVESETKGLQWWYWNNSPTSHWPYVTEKTCHPRQSPVDLVTHRAVYRALPTLQLVQNTVHGTRGRLNNNGHSVMVSMDNPPEDRPQLKGGPLLNDKFYFEQMHFHWGSEDEWGSEHFIDGESFAAETHLVFWNSKYGSFAKASKKDDGLAVLTVFAEGKNKSDNPLLTPLRSLLSNVSDFGLSCMMDIDDAMQWPISALKDVQGYYSYPGSLTTSPFSENVVFILLPKPIYLSYDQLHAFKSIHDSVGRDITDNKRKLQPLHRRPIVRAYGILVT